MMRIVAYLLCVLWLSSCASAQGNRDTGNLIPHSIAVGERERMYLLYSPQSLPSIGEPLPLVIVFHGGGGTARASAREVGKSLHRIADREKFYVAYPNAVNKMWDFGAGEVSQSLQESVDDRGFFAALLDDLTQGKRIDPHRVFATGISRGGQASYFIACNFPDRIRAIAPVAMPMPVFMREFCMDVADIGVAIINGTRDPLVPYDGGDIKVGRRKRGKVMPTDDTVAYWRTRNQCAASPTGQHEINPVANDRMRVRKTSWEECRQAPVVLYRIEGGGHTWPSGMQYLPRFVIGPVNRDIDGATEVWEFFERFQ